VVEFLTAAQSLAAQYPKMRFLLIGARLVSDHAGAVETAIDAAQQALGDRLILTGLRPDVPELLAAMDVFSLPSYREGMPRTIIEAMMMGKPVVATNIRGAREEVVEGVTGWLVPTRDTDAFAKALGQCFENQQQARSMGFAGRQRAMTLYNEEKIVALQLEHIRSYAQQQGLLAGEKFVPAGHEASI
jgi:glycosyltransferase involved in cell wall biosynthesis